MNSFYWPREPGGKSLDTRRFLLILSRLRGDIQVECRIRSRRNLFQQEIQTSTELLNPEVLSRYRESWSSFPCFLLRGHAYQTTLLLLASELNLIDGPIVPINRSEVTNAPFSFSATVSPTVNEFQWLWSQTSCINKSYKMMSTY